MRCLFRLFALSSLGLDLGPGRRWWAAASRLARAFRLRVDGAALR